MPRRAVPGNRAAIEAALSPTLRAALGELRELLDVDDWTETPLGPVFATAAAVALAGKLAREGGSSPTRALETAAARLGLPVEAIRSRAGRWSEDSRANVQHERGARRAGVYALIEDEASARRPEDDAA